MPKARKQPRPEEHESEPLGEGSLCGACETRAEGSTCPRCGTPLVLDGQWVLENKLGEGGQSRVYAARSIRDGARAAIKVMSLDRARDWKNVELFERSAKVLANLDHPGIPTFIASFRVEANAVVLFCLVHERIDGETLKATLERGERYDEKKARQVLREVLGILRYLHGLSPPVIHRDLKPSNLMRRRSGGVVLIDFDLVRDDGKPDGGSTIGIGTPGYAPIEQLMGEAVPATDLYALGATLVALLSRKEPSALREKGAQSLDFERYVNVSKDFESILAGLLEPAVADRFQTAAAVLARLDAPSPTDTLRRRGREKAGTATEETVLEKWAGLRSLLFGGATPRRRGREEARTATEETFFVKWGAVGAVGVGSLIGAAQIFAEVVSPAAPQPAATQAPAASAWAVEEDPKKVRDALLQSSWVGEISGAKLSVALRARGDELETTATERDGTPRPTMVARVNPAGLVLITEDFTLFDVAHHLSCSGELARDGASIRGTCDDTLTRDGSKAKESTSLTLHATKKQTP
jgi:hypothetical protein